MNKFMTKVVGICLGLTMAVGVGVAAESNKEAVPVRAAGTDVTWDLTAASYDSATESAVTYSNDAVTIVVAIGTSTTNPNNYLPTAQAHSRWYKGNILTVTPKSGYQVNSFSVTATTANYQKWTAGSNCSGTTSTATLTVTPSDKTSAFTLNTTATGRYTQFAVNYETKSSDPVTYTDVTISEKTAMTGIYKGDAYYECQASVSGTGAYNSSVTWSITNSDTYGTGTTIDSKASIDSNGKITFLDNCTVYVWATAADGATHNANGFSVISSGLFDNPISTWTKITDSDNVSTNGIYTLSNDGTNFGANAVASKQIALATSLSNIGYFALEATNGGYYLRFATYNSTNSVWEANGNYINYSGDSTDLSSSSNASTVWIVVENGTSGVYLKISSGRHLGLGNSGIKAYANIGSNSPVYLYSAGSLPVIECAAIELTGVPASGMSIGDTATLGYSALDGSANEWTGDVTYRVLSESTSGVIELSATSGESITLTAKKAGTATISVQDTDGNATPDTASITVLADPERTELPIGSYNVEIDYSGVAKGDTVPASKDYEIKAKEGTGVDRVWYKNMTISYSNVTASYATEYTFSKDGNASSATVTTTSESAKVTQVVISYYNANRLTMTDAGDKEIDVASSSNNICTYALNSESFTLSSTSTATSIYYIHITFAVVDESEEFLSLVINKGSTATSFTEGDAPNHEGLTVHENYSTDGETISRFVDVTNSVTWNYNIETISANTTSYTVTATYGGHTSDPVTVNGFTVTTLSKYTHVESQNELFDGQVVILAVVGTNNKTALAYDSSKLTTQDANFLGEKIASNSEMEFVVRMYGDKFALERNGSFLNYNGSSNNVYLSEETLDSDAAKCGWILDSTGLYSAEGNRYLKYNYGSPRFACYGDNNEYQVVQLYKADSSVMNVQNKADTFLYRELHLRDISTSDNTDGTACKGNSGFYVTAKATFSADSFADARTTVLANADAVARLQAWAAANGETFDSSNGTFVKASSRIIAGIFNNDNSTLDSAILIVSLVGITAIGAYFFIRRRKEQ